MRTSIGVVNIAVCGIGRNMRRVIVETVGCQHERVDKTHWMNLPEPPSEKESGLI